MRRVKPFHRALLAVLAGSTLALLLVWWAEHAGTGGGDDRRAAGAPTATDSGPRLRGRGPRSTKGSPPEEAEGTSDEVAGRGPWETPPAVYAQPERPPPEPPVALTIRVTFPWGELGIRRLGGDTEGSPGSWLVPQWEMPLAEEALGSELSGRGDLTGTIRLGAETVAEWGRRPLVVSADGCREHVMGEPPRPLPSVLDVRLEADAPPVHFRGRVVDAQGEGLGRAGVFLDGRSEPPGVRTAADGTFDLQVAPAMLGVLDPDGDEQVDIVAVAPGRVAARVTCRTSGQDDMQIVLVLDTVHARLEIDFQQADGAPAAGARAWLYLAGPRFQAALGWEERGLQVRATGAEADTRRLLPRLLGGLSIDEQGYELAQDVGPILQDLVADEGGRLLLPAVLPGRYHLRAARADRTAPGHDAPEFGTLHVRETLDTDIEVLAPPAPTHLTLRLESGRTVSGRAEVAVDPAWHCAHRDGHSHWLSVDDWVWGGVAIRSGASNEHGHTIRDPGAFHLDGVPRTACRLRLATFGHPEVQIDLPELPDGVSGEQDLGTIVVPDARKIQVRLLRADGNEPDPAHWLWEATVEGFPGVEAPGYAASDGRFDFYAPAPPPAGAVIVVTARDGGRVLVRAPVPRSFDPEHPTEIRVPDIPAVPADGRAEAKGSK